MGFVTGVAAAAVSYGGNCFNRSGTVPREQYRPNAGTMAMCVNTLQSRLWPGGHSRRLVYGTLSDVKNAVNGKGAGRGGTGREGEEGGGVPFVRPTSIFYHFRRLR